VSFQSRGGCKDEFVEHFGGCLVSVGLSWSLVEFVGDEVEVGFAEWGVVGSSRLIELSVTGCW
jgi:hypothetical protein